VLANNELLENSLRLSLQDYKDLGKRKNVNKTESNLLPFHEKNQIFDFT
jgi:hypothetical protein